MNAKSQARMVDIRGDHHCALGSDSEAQQASHLTSATIRVRG